nr:siderophore-interacting protein [uncultured Microbacterium sp.]
MTNSRPPLVDRSLPLHEQEAILSGDHNRGMHRTRATVREIIDVSDALARVALHIDGLADDANWLLPNTAIRLHLDDAGERVTRIYTVRAADAVSEMIEVDVVRHGESSPMMRWLRDLRIGDEVPLVGPRPHFRFPEANGREVLAFADATSLPALHTLLEQAPRGIRGRGWVATADEAAFAELPAVEGFVLERIEPGTGFGPQIAACADADAVVWPAVSAMRCARSARTSASGGFRRPTPQYSAIGSEARRTRRSTRSVCAPTRASCSAAEPWANSTTWRCRSDPPATGIEEGPGVEPGAFFFSLPQFRGLR